MIERKARTFNIQKYNMYDGPGVRTIVFFKGCPLRCQWCSNPESQLRQFQLMFKANLCVDCGACVPVCPAGIHAISQEGKHVIDRSKECVGCRKCEKQCTKSALAVMGENQTISELLDIVEEDRAFYEMSGGGLTLGGGEALMQPEAAVSLMQACKQSGINTAIETCGYARLEVLQQVAEFTDLFLFDVKHMDSERHYELTGVRNEMILSNLVWLLENRHSVKVRVPLLKGINDSEDEINQLINFLKPYQDHKNFQGIDLLPYHKMGVGKYKQLDREYPIEGDPALTESDIERVERCITQYNFPVSVVRH